MSTRVLLVDAGEETPPFLGDLSEQIVFHRVTEAMEGCRLLTEESFDAVLLDLSLPDEWGLEAFTRLSTIAPDTPVILLTRPEDEELTSRAVGVGATAQLPRAGTSAEKAAATIREAMANARKLGAEDENDRESGLWARPAFLRRAASRLLLAELSGKSIFLFTIEARPDTHRAPSVGSVMKLTFRTSDLLGRTGETSYGAIGLVHPTDDSEQILARRFDEVLRARNATVDHAHPLLLSWHLERLDPGTTMEELRDHLSERA